MYSLDTFLSGVTPELTPDINILMPNNDNIWLQNTVSLPQNIVILPKNIDIWPQNIDM